VFWTSNHAIPDRRTHGDIGLRTAADDPEARVVLVQDGVFLSPALDAELYAVEKDVDVRGIDLLRKSRRSRTTI